MRLLPREHGATAIWLASVVFAFLILPGAPGLLPSVSFVAVCLAALLLVAAFTGRSAVLVRLERNPNLLPALSSPLTLIAPLGYVLMAGPLTWTVLAAWLVFLVYTATGIVYTGEAVRAVLKDAPPNARLLAASAVLLAAESAVFAVLGWLSLASVAVLVPLLAHRLAGRTRLSPESAPKARRIRTLGFAESANLLAAAAILALASRL